MKRCPQTLFTRKGNEKGVTVGFLWHRMNAQKEVREHLKSQKGTVFQPVHMDRSVGLPEHSLGMFKILICIFTRVGWLFYFDTMMKSRGTFWRNGLPAFAR